MKTNLSERMISLILAIVLLVGVLPTAAFATEEEEATTTTTENVEMVPVGDDEETVTDEVTEDTELPAEEVIETTTEPVEEEAENVTTPAEQDAVNTIVTTAEADVVNVTNGKTFTMQGRYLDLLHNHSEYGVQDYLISEWQDEIRIYFMEGDTSSITFKVWDSGSDSLANSFGVRATTNVWFMSYIYDKNTLTQIRSSRQLMPTTDMRIYSYSFAASFDIYKTSALDGNFKEFFYDANNTRPGVPDTTIPEDAVTVTNGKTFTMQGKYLKLLQSHNYYGTRDYIASEWQDEIRFYFFEDISNVEFSVWDSGNDGLVSSFGARPSRNVWAIEYVYDKDTLIQKRSSRQLFSTGDARTYSYFFVSSFNIYANTNYEDANLFFDRSGTLPGIVPGNPPEDLWNFTSGTTFSATGTLLWLLQNHSEYGAENYIAYEGDTEFRILFFHNASNVKFTVCNNSVTSFGISPSQDVPFTEYAYNKDTLRLKRAREKTFTVENDYVFKNPFTASIVIYADGSDGKKFFDPNQNLSENPTLHPSEDISFTTNRKTFTLPGAYAWLLLNQEEYGKKDYFAYQDGNSFVISFFDNISGVKFTRRNNGHYDSFGMKVSAQVKFVEYTYDTNTFMLKSLTNRTIDAGGEITCAERNFIASFDIRMADADDQYFYMVNGEQLPTLPPKYEKKEWKEENAQKFHMDEVYCKKIRECPEYKQGQRYLAYLWLNDFVIWFFDDPNVQFSVWDRSGNKLRNSFGVNPSVDTQFKAYVFSTTTLNLKSEAVNPLGKNSGYILVYDFVSNIDIYTDESYLNYFYKGNGDYVKNTTDGRTFAIPNAAYEEVKDLISDLRGGDENSENYIAFASGDEFKVWFLNDNDVRFCVKESDTSTFKLQPASNTRATEYVFDRTTLTQKEEGLQIVTLQKSGEYPFNNNFFANFNIYSDDTYSEYFYNAAHSNVEFTRTFQPLKPKEAEAFLRFLTDVGWLVNVKKEMPEYYNLLIGEIKDPKEELRTRAEFLFFAGHCISLQQAQWKYQMNWGTNNLQTWLNNRDNLHEFLLIDPYSPQSLADENNSGNEELTEAEKKAKIEENIKGIIIASLQRLEDLLKLKYNQDKVKEILAGVEDPTNALDLMSVGFALVNGLGVARAEKNMSDINLLAAHRRILGAIEGGDELAIERARAEYALVETYKATFSNPDKAKKYAEYLFSIERSMFNYPF